MWVAMLQTGPESFLFGFGEAEQEAIDTLKASLPERLLDSDSIECFEAKAGQTLGIS